MKSAMEKFINYLDSHIPHFIVGWLAAFLNYFEPVNSVIHLVIILSLVDWVTGIFVSFKHKKSITSKKMWRTITKLFYEILIIVLVYGIDKEVGSIELHKLIAWFICGIEFWSILENICKVSNSRVFRYVRRLTEMKIEDLTKIDISRKNQNGNDTNLNNKTIN